MPAYFISDVHLRLDRPDRGLRLARWVEALGPGDDLTIVGDLCDFWFSSRQARPGLAGCPGLDALRRFSDRGGILTIVAGNHDAQIGHLYVDALGARFEAGPIDVEAGGLRVHAVHGHLLGARPPWKGLMEGRLFLRAFGALPGPIASAMERRLDRSNLRNKPESDRRFLAVYGDYARSLAGSADLVVFGHIHLTRDDASGSPRVIVLGDWIEGTLSYLKIDASGAELVVDDGPRKGPGPVEETGQLDCV